MDTDKNIPSFRITKERKSFSADTQNRLGKGDVIDIEAGEADKNGKYPKNSVNGRIMTRLQNFTKTL